MSFITKLAGKAAKNAPNIWTVVSVIGVASSAFLTGWGVIRAYEACSMAEDDLVDEWFSIPDDDENKPEEAPHLEAKDVIKIGWPYMVPAAIVVVLTMTSIILTRTTSASQTQSALTAYAIARNDAQMIMQEYKNTHTEKETKALRDKLAQNYIDEMHPTSSIVIADDEAKVLCYEKPFNHEFKSSYEDIRAAVNTINEQFRTDVWVSLNEFYYILGIPPTPLGYDLGWHVDNGYLDVEYSASVNRQHKPCLVIDFRLDERISGKIHDSARTITTY